MTICTHGNAFNEHTPGCWHFCSEKNEEEERKGEKKKKKERKNGCSPQKIRKSESGVGGEPRTMRKRCWKSRKKEKKSRWYWQLKTFAIPVPHISVTSILLSFITYTFFENISTVPAIWAIWASREAHVYMYVKQAHSFHIRISSAVYAVSPFSRDCGINCKKKNNVTYQLIACRKASDAVYFSANWWNGLEAASVAPAIRRNECLIIAKNYVDLDRRVSSFAVITFRALRVFTSRTGRRITRRHASRHRLHVPGILVTSPLFFLGSARLRLLKNFFPACPRSRE